MAVTGTTMEQLPDAGIVPPERARDDPPLVIVTVPPQELDEGVPAVFCMLVEGYVSVKAAPVIDVALGFVSVMVMFVVPETGNTAGLKLLAVVGGSITVSVADASAMSPSLVVMVPVWFK